MRVRRCSHFLSETDSYGQVIGFIKYSGRLLHKIGIKFPYANEQNADTKSRAGG